MTGLALDKDDRLKKQTDDIIASFKDMPGIGKSKTAKKWGAAAAKAKGQEGDEDAGRIEGTEFREESSGADNPAPDRKEEEKQRL